MADSSTTDSNAQQPHKLEDAAPDPPQDLGTSASKATDQGDQLASSHLLIASCSKCSADFAEFYNDWRQITGSYYLPSRRSSYRLYAKTKQRLAATGTALQGCTIQPLACSKCDETVAILCKKAPDDKIAYIDREFYKLPKIKLRSISTGGQVEPIIAADQQSPNHSPAIEATNMDRSGGSPATAVQKPSLPSISVLGHQPQIESRRAEPPSARTVPSQPLQPKPGVSDRVTSTSLPPGNGSPLAATTTSMSSTSRSRSQVNGAGSRTYPAIDAIKLDAIDRIQAQVNLNKATLESCTRDMARMENSFRALHAEVRSTFEAVRAELATVKHQQIGNRGVASDSLPIDDQSLEVFSSTLSQVVSKVSEVDILKVQFEVIKRRLQRLEEGDTSPTNVTSGYTAHQRMASMYRPLVAQQHVQIPGQPQRASAEPRILPSQSAKAPSYTAAPTQPDTASPVSGPGWVSVNAGTKRPLSQNVGSPDDVDETPMGSPKRTKLAPLEPRYAYPVNATPTTYDRTATEEGASNRGREPALQESYTDSAHYSTCGSYVQEGGPDDSWRPASQRVVSDPTMQTSPRGRGRGRGRAGRPRKSTPLEPHLFGTPEWEREGWTGSQVDADGFYRGGVVMRGHGGAPGVTMTAIQSIDAFGQSKRSRTKPVRNAEGILIRKDGRPDMRSQSSALNLRKVHAKKEEEKLGLSTTGSVPPEGTTSVGESPAASTDGHDIEVPNTRERRVNILDGLLPKVLELEFAMLESSRHHLPSNQSQTGTTASTPVQRARSENADVENASSAKVDKADSLVNVREPGKVSEVKDLPETRVPNVSTAVETNPPSAPSEVMTLAATSAMGVLPSETPITQVMIRSST